MTKFKILLVEEDYELFNKIPNSDVRYSLFYKLIKVIQNTQRVQPIILMFEDQVWRIGKSINHIEQLLNLYIEYDKLREDHKKNKGNTLTERLRNIDVYKQQSEYLLSKIRDVINKMSNVVVDGKSVTLSKLLDLTITNDILISKPEVVSLFYHNLELEHDINVIELTLSQ